MNQVDIRQLIKDEYKKCAADPIYFIRKYCVIQEPLKGRIPFDLYGYQENAIMDFQNNQFTIILKGRQIGISTAVACYALWLMLFHRDKNVLIIATKQDTAKNLITKVRFAFDSLPKYLQIPCVEKNKLSLRFKNGSQIKASTAAGDSGRSEALSLLILDEAAFIENAKEIWTAALPTLSTGGKAVLISTPNGMGNFFHQKYSEAIQEISAAETQEGEPKLRAFHPIKLDWSVHPDRDAQWRQQAGKDLGERQARQEFDAEFIGSGNTVIDGELIEAHKKKYMMVEPLEKWQSNRDLWIFKKRNLDAKYVVVADVARGDGADFSACHILELETLKVEQVAEFKGKLSTREWGVLLIEIATYYNMALLVVERETVGWDTIQTILNMNYPNMFYMSKDLKVVDVHRTVGNLYRNDETKMVPGFGTTITTRPVMINALDMYMRELNYEREALVMHSPRFYEELEVFIWHRGETRSKAQAMEGYNDDLVMALCIGLWVRDMALRLNQIGIDITKASLDGFSRSGISETDTSPIFMPNRLLHDPYHMPMGNPTPLGDAEFEDLRLWLG